MCLAWKVPTHHASVLRQASRMVMTMCPAHATLGACALQSLRHPRNAAIMRRPGMLACVHNVADRLCSMVQRYGAGVLDWAYIITVAGGLEASHAK